MSDVVSFLHQKLDEITVEFLAEPTSYGVVYEAQFLAYLECLVMAKGLDPTRVWSDFIVTCTEAAGDGEAVQGYSSRLCDHQELVDALRAFQRRFEAPRRMRLKSTVQHPLVASSTRDGPLGLFDLLGD